MRRQLGVGAVCLAMLAGCVTPATTTAAYEAKAALTAQDATSAVRTALLAVRTFGDDDLQHSYLEVMLVESETSLGAVQATFESVQPPDSAQADRWRQQLGTLLDAGTTGLADLRIAARRDQPDELLRTSHALTDTADQLDAFGSEHAS